MGAPKIELSLNQRRLITKFQAEAFKTWKEELNHIVGFDIKVDCDWNSFFFSVDGQTDDSIYDGWKRNFCEPLTVAFKKACADEMGKQAVKSAVKEIKIIGNWGDPRDCSFKDGVFTLTRNPISGSHSVEQLGQYWQEIIERGL